MKPSTTFFSFRVFLSSVSVSVLISFHRLVLVNYRPDLTRPHPPTSYLRQHSLSLILQHTQSDIGHKVIVNHLVDFGTLLKDCDRKFHYKVSVTVRKKAVSWIHVKCMNQEAKPGLAPPHTYVIQQLGTVTMWVKCDFARKNINETKNIS